MTKKIFALVMVVSVLGSIFVAGCKGGDDTSKDAPAAGKDATKDAPKDDASKTP